MITDMTMKTNKRVVDAMKNIDRLAYMFNSHKKELTQNKYLILAERIRTELRIKRLEEEGKIRDDKKKYEIKSRDVKNFIFSNGLYYDKDYFKISKNLAVDKYKVLCDLSHLIEFGTSFSEQELALVAEYWLHAYIQCQDNSVKILEQELFNN